MKIELMEVTVGELFEGYEDKDDEGVVGYGGILDIRPSFQREFVYKDAQRDAVIDTVLKKFPLNVMYWCETNRGTYEVLDGQQRTISLCQYINGDFSIKYDGEPMYFDNLYASEKNAILNYPLMIYVCEGSDKEKLDWFKTINIAGEQLTTQELRNAVYSGTWVSDAKKYFSKKNAPAHDMAKDYLSGAANRQAYLEAAIRWKADVEDLSIEEYMAMHQNDVNACELWTYFVEVIDWLKRVFLNYRKEMKGLDWGIWYNKYKNKSFNPVAIETEISELYKDDEVTSKKGIYAYILTGEEKHLSIRTFTESQKAQAYEKCGGVCAKCGKQFKLDEMQADHIMPWSKGGKTELDNCQMLCSHCNAAKSNKY